MQPYLQRPDPATFGRSLTAGLGVNLLVASVEGALPFQRDVLGARVLWCEADFAILNALGSLWMLHSDRSYRAHPLGRAVAGVGARGLGVELRLYGLDPDAVAARAEAAGAVILSPPLDRPHGLREAHVVDGDGYVWAPCVACGAL